MGFLRGLEESSLSSGVNFQTVIHTRDNNTRRDRTHSAQRFLLRSQPFSELFSNPDQSPRNSNFINFYDINGPGPACLDSCLRNMMSDNDINDQIGPGQHCVSS